MDYIECDVPQGDGYCTDNECPCAPAQISRGEGYLLITPEIVEYRRNALTRAQLQDILAPRLKAGEYISSTAYEPMLICEQAAKTRGLDMDAAAEDARKWWETGTAPLRATPTASAEPASAAETFADEAPVAPEKDDSPPREEPRSPEPQQITPAPPPPVESVPTPSEPASTPAEPRPEAPAEEGSGPGTDSLSADQVAEQFADGPLAELAAKMARGQNAGDDPVPDDPPQRNPGATAVNPSDESTVVAAVQPQRLDESSEEKPTATQPAKPRKKPGTGAVVALYTLLGVLTLIVGVVGVLVLRKIRSQREVAEKPALSSIRLETDKDDPPRAMDFASESETAEPREGTERAEQPSAPVESAESAVSAPQPQTTTSVKPSPGKPTLGSGFFENVYSFRDSRYQGAIEFRNVDGGEGAYRQQVRIAGKPKVYTVEGRFVSTKNRIVFSPEGAETKVVWQLEKLDPGTGSAVFFDPRHKDRAASRVYLKPSR